jgi:MazG family protein
VLDGITQNLPAISLAQKIQQRVARVGFDWPDWHGVLDKVFEEADEVRNAWANAQARQEEIGDLLFACINLARHADCDAEAALRHANRKFTERFQQLESLAEQEGIVLEHASLDTLEALWKRAKSATE